MAIPRSVPDKPSEQVDLTIYIVIDEHWCPLVDLCRRRRRRRRRKRRRRRREAMMEEMLVVNINDNYKTNHMFVKKKENV